jgi:parallel beta-helix repeat protein
MSIFKKPSIKVFTLSLLIAAFSSVPSSALPPQLTQITQCGTVISQPGHYILANDLSCAGAGTPLSPVLGSDPAPPSTPTDGINIVADHVNLMLDGHTISGALSNFGITVGVGVAAGNSHVSIVGPGTVSGFFAEVVFEQVSHSTVSDVTVTGGQFGFFIASGVAVGCTNCPSTMNDFQGNTATANGAGFTLDGADDNTIRDNNASNNLIDGIELTVATKNDVRGNTLNGNVRSGIQVNPDTGTDNRISGNTALNNGDFDLVDENTNCDSNMWKNNTFVTANRTCIQ